MPNKNTFSIPPIERLVKKYLTPTSIDPFANESKIADVTNDIVEEYNADYHMDALDFFKTFGDNSVSTVLFDLPYSPRQISEVYKKVGKSVNMETTQSSFWTALKREVARVLRPGGYAITCAWNSGGIGSSLGMTIVEILMVPHGGWHNDTIVTVERKDNQIF